MVFREMHVGGCAQEQEKAAKAAAAAAAAAWGERQLRPLEAEDRLAVACEKAPTEDAVLGQLRAVFQDLEATYAAQCDAQKAEVRAFNFFLTAPPIYPVIIICVAACLPGVLL